ncbi:toxic anion resistance protein [Micromonospora sp. WMMD1082]|uniref:toxic anion resistance protein n=1 Tax=Micromonospora sp. WMMD1082 TaxID=3016104 RepID=UPI002415CC51|nr:toxic anion resistance protein [Micromonospora sp. WMMD1082]MDG4797071.1 toxic anion resistance protein [Micromonospora sp. WMMD1082]
MTDGLQIDFGSIVGGAAEPPAGAADTAITGALTAGQPRELVCSDLLTPAQRSQAEAAARQLYPAMLANTEQLASFGNSAIDQVNTQVSRIFKEVGRVDIPELTSIMRQLNDRMRTFRRKYDPSDPRIRETFNKFSDAVKGLFRKGRDLLEMLFEEARTVEQQLDRVAGQLSAKQHELRRNVVLCDELYKANEAAIGQLIGAIAVMELVRDEALAEARSITVTPGAVDERDQQERLSLVTEFIQALEVRINEFQQRLFVAWSTSPQVRNIRTLNYGLGQRLALLMNLTIPTMKLTIAQWALLLQANQAADMQQAVADGANDVLSAYARASQSAVPQIARTIQTPTIRPETLLEVAESIDAQARGIEEAVRYGQQKRAEVVDAIVTANQSMAQSANRLSQTVVELVTRAKQPLELPAGPQLPASVLEQAPAVRTDQQSR